MDASPPRRRVLFIEDEPALRTSYQRYFHPRYDMAFAASGSEALSRLRVHAPEVVVLDMRLPDTDGVDLLRRIREVRPDLPVIITTAYVSSEPQLRMLDLAYSGYLVKPFDLDTLAQTIDDTG
jgi:CheY-like chemotaxis protein